MYYWHYCELMILINKLVIFNSADHGNIGVRLLKEIANIVIPLVHVQRCTLSSYKLPTYFVIKCFNKLLEKLLCDRVYHYLHSLI